MNRKRAMAIATAVPIATATLLAGYWKLLTYVDSKFSLKEQLAFWAVLLFLTIWNATYQICRRHL